MSETPPPRMPAKFSMQISGSGECKIGFALRHLLTCDWELRALVEDADTGYRPSVEQRAKDTV